MPNVSELARQEEEALATGEKAFKTFAIVTVKANSLEEAQTKVDRLVDDHPWLDVSTSTEMVEDA